VELECRVRAMGCAGVPLNESVPVQDDFVTGIDHIETVAKSSARFVLYVEEEPLPGQGPQRTAVRKICVPHHCLPKMMRKTLRYMALHHIEIGKRVLSKLLS
jgi:hypothetical protein